MTPNDMNGDDPDSLWPLAAALAYTTSAIAAVTYIAFLT